MPKTSLRERLEDFVFESELVLKRVAGDEFTNRLFDDMTTELAARIPSMNFDEDRQTHRNKLLLCLGQLPHDYLKVGAMSCQRAVYLGANGKIYIEGPRRRLGATVIDIHPYGVRDARGWGGISKSSLVDMLAPYFI